MYAAQQWLPYCGSGPEPTEWLERWNFDAVLLGALALFLLGASITAPDRKNSHAGAVLTVLILFVSPFCALGSALFSVRVVHHLLLALVLAPLVAQSLNLDRRRFPGSLAAWTALQAVVFWAWHIPQFYGAALSNDIVFWIMQASLSGTSALWWARLRQASAPAAVAALLASMVQMGVLGALLTFAGRAFYAPHWLTVQAWGLSPMEDQQIAGLIMWAPASAVYLLLALAILYRDMGSLSHRGDAAG